MSGTRNRVTGAAAALAALATATSASAAPADQWLALSLLYRADATIVTAPCNAPQESATQQPPPPPSPPAAGEPATPPIGCPPPNKGRRPGIYVGIAVAAAAGVGAAVALSSNRRANSP